MTNKANSVYIAAADPVWPQQFIEERTRLLYHIPNAHIEHIGSTAVPHLRAKPIIDIIVGAPTEDLLATYIQSLSELGYFIEGKRNNHQWLSWPSPTRRKFIIHLVVFDDEEWRRRLAFRDHLRINKVATKAYQNLKLKLATVYKDDIDAYTAAKAQFVQDILNTQND
jgi:GrpB-like predicted nucleotidyltransferase (UPF0157 family)